MSIVSPVAIHGGTEYLLWPQVRSRGAIVHVWAFRYTVVLGCDIVICATSAILVVMGAISQRIEIRYT